MKFWFSLGSSMRCPLGLFHPGKTWKQAKRCQVSLWPTPSCLASLPGPLKGPSWPCGMVLPEFRPVVATVPGLGARDPCPRPAALLADLLERTGRAQLALTLITTSHSEHCCLFPVTL